MLTRKPNIALVIAEKFSIDTYELKAFRPGNDPRGERNRLYTKILEGAYKAPSSWVAFALKLAKVVRALNESVIHEGAFNPFSLKVDKRGRISLLRGPKMSTYRGAINGDSNVFDSKLMGWALPVGLILRAAATGRANELLGVTAQARLGLAGAITSVIRYGGRLPLAAGIIIDRLCTWPGSRIKGYQSMDEFCADVNSLKTVLTQQTAGDTTLVDVKQDGVQDGMLERSPFTVVLCQVPSFSPKADDAMIRRALSIARLILKQKDSKGGKVDLVIFPELSVPKSSLGTLCRFARQTRTLVLAGLALHHSRDGKRIKSTCLDCSIGF